MSEKPDTYNTVHKLPSGAEVRNQHKITDGKFNRRVTTAGGIILDLDCDYSLEQIDYLCKRFDLVAQVNYKNGMEQAQLNMREALGIRR